MEDIYRQMKRKYNSNLKSSFRKKHNTYKNKDKDDTINMTRFEVDDIWKEIQLEKWKG